MDLIEIKNTSKKLDVSESMISDSTIINSCLTNSVFKDVNASGIKFSDANLSDIEINYAQLGGAYIHNIGMPPAGHPNYEPGVKQLPLRFEECDLNNSTFTACHLEGVSIKDCDITGMRINNILVEDLLKAYQAGR